MALIGSIDGPNRRIYLHADTQNTELDPIDVYKEMRTLRRTTESLRKFDLYLRASGYVSKGEGKFTPKLTTCLLGCRLVPYDSTHTLTITGEIITDAGTSGLACFDKTLLTPGSNVDINYFPPQVEVIEVATGGGSSLTAQQIWEYVIASGRTAEEELEEILKKAKLAANKL